MGINVVTKLQIACPICGCICDSRTEQIYSYSLGRHESCQIFLCYGSLAPTNNHYYSHMVSSDAPDKILSQEFSIDMEHDYISFNNDYRFNKSYIYTSHSPEPIELDTILVPDFPDLKLLSKRIKTILVFG